MIYLLMEKFILKELIMTDIEEQMLSYIKNYINIQKLLLKKDIGRSMKDMHINADGLYKCFWLD